MNEAERQSEFRKLPAVDALLRMPAIALLAAEVGVERMTETLRSLLAEARAAIAAGRPAPEAGAWPALAEDALAGSGDAAIAAARDQRHRRDCASS